MKEELPSSKFWKAYFYSEKPGKNESIVDPNSLGPALVQISESFGLASDILNGGTTAHRNSYKYH